MFPFGKDFQAWFYPLVDDRTPTSILTTGALVAIYIFDSMPTRSAAADGTGAVQTVSSWAWDAGKSGFSFTVAAIDDPDPTSTVSTRTYWYAVNLRLQTSEQVQTDVRTFDLERVTGPAFAVEVTEDDLAAHYPQINSYSSQPQRLAFITQAKEDAKSTLRSKGYQWARIHRADRLNMAVTFKALSMFMLAQVQQPGDKFALKYAEYKGMYDNAMESLSFEYDGDGDGLPETQAEVSSTLFLVR